MQNTHRWQYNVTHLYERYTLYAFILYRVICVVRNREYDNCALMKIYIIAHSTRYRVEESRCKSRFISDVRCTSTCVYATRVAFARPHHRCPPPSSYTCSKSVVFSQYSLRVFIVRLKIRLEDCFSTFRHVYTHTWTYNPRVFKYLIICLAFLLSILLSISTFDSMMKLFSVNVDFRLDSNWRKIFQFLWVNLRGDISLIVICQSLVSFSSKSLWFKCIIHLTVCQFRKDCLCMTCVSVDALQ